MLRKKSHITTKNARKRKITKNNSYPNKIGEKRQIHSVLRNKEGKILRPIFDNDNHVIRYELLNINDLDDILPDKTGKRTAKMSDLEKLNVEILDNDYKGEIFKYCIHQEKQKLLSISEFTSNNPKGRCPNKLKENSIYPNKGLQPFCKESKYKYVNNGSAGNSTRSREQLAEGSCGSRLRGLLVNTVKHSKRLDEEEIFEKYGHKCFNCGAPLIKGEKKGNKSKYEFDHTLPSSKWYGITTEDATLLCKVCNDKKRNSWPGDFYTEFKNEDLSKLTNINVGILLGEPTYNEEIVDALLNDFSETMKKLEEWGRRNENKKKTEFFKFWSKELKNLIKYNKKHNNEKISKLIILFTNYLTKTEEGLF